MSRCREDGGGGGAVWMSRCRQDGKRGGWMEGGSRGLGKGVLVPGCTQPGGELGSGPETRLDAEQEKGSSESLKSYPCCCAPTHLLSERGPRGSSEPFLPPSTDAPPKPPERAFGSSGSLLSHPPS